MYEKLRKTSLNMLLLWSRLWKLLYDIRHVADIIIICYKYELGRVNISDFDLHLIPREQKKRAWTHMWDRFPRGNSAPLGQVLGVLIQGACNPRSKVKPIRWIQSQLYSCFESSPWIRYNVDTYQLTFES